MPFTPYTDRVLVRRLEEASSKTTGNFSIPDAAKEKPQEGIVLACGPGTLDISGERVPLQCAVGDHVAFGKYAGTALVVDSEELLIMHESEILGHYPA